MTADMIFYWVLGFVMGCGFAAALLAGQWWEERRR